MTDKLCLKILERKTTNYDYVYPVSSGPMLKKYNEFIERISKVDNLITFGRLGLYSYISMCTAINQAADIAEQLSEILEMKQDEKCNYYKRLRERLS